MLKCPRCGHWEPLHVGLCVLSLCCHRFLVFPYFLVPQDVPVSYYIFFPILVLETSISVRILGFFYWKMVFRNQNPVTKCAHHYLGFSTDKVGDINANTHTNTHLFLYICIIVIYIFYYTHELLVITQIPIQHYMVCSSPLYFFYSEKNSHHYRQSYAIFKTVSEC